jgi:hypothetical protein
MQHSTEADLRYGSQWKASNPEKQYPSSRNYRFPVDRHIMLCWKEVRHLPLRRSSLEDQLFQIGQNDEFDRSESQEQNSKSTPRRRHPGQEDWLPYSF